MISEEELKILQTTILLLDNVQESEIMIKYNLYNYLKKAKKIIEVYKNTHV